MVDKKITLQRAINCYRPCRPNENDKRYKEAKSFFEKNGFYFEEIWSLDQEFAYWILVRLVLYRDKALGIPLSFCTDISGGWPKEKPGDFKRWRSCIDKMIRGFYLYCSVDLPDKKQTQLIEKAMRLFAKNWKSLWD